MSKRVISVLLILISLIGILPLHAFAADQVQPVDIIPLEDGSYIVVSVETSPARIANTVSGSKLFTCYGEDDTVLWVATLSATFAYSGAWYTCTTANCDITIYSNHWHETANSVRRSSNHAYADFTMKRIVLGITAETIERTMVLTCNSNGTLS